VVGFVVCRERVQLLLEMHICVNLKELIKKDTVKMPFRQIFLLQISLPLSGMVSASTPLESKRHNERKLQER
jgi:hypothetical protein